MHSRLLNLILFFCVLITQVTCAQEERQSTANENVEVLENFVHVPYSVSSRTIRVYTPPSYNNSDKRYPVIYMLDGQNLFDDKTSYAGEWGIDESMDQLIAEGLPEAIVVGIDNHGVFRMQEYNVYDSDRFGPQQGYAFTRFLVESLKPMIDKKYRTLTEAEHTAIVGSSMGGLMAYYILMTQPKTFSKAGVFSPSFWVNEAIYSIHQENEALKTCKIYMLVGGEEGQMVPLAQRMEQVLTSEIPKDQLYSAVVPNEGHNEAFWRKEFPKMYRWLF